MINETFVFILVYPLLCVCFSCYYFSFVMITNIWCEQMRI